MRGGWRTESGVGLERSALTTLGWVMLMMPTPCKMTDLITKAMGSHYMILSMWGWGGEWTCGEGGDLPICVWQRSQWPNLLFLWQNFKQGLDVSNTETQEAETLTGCCNLAWSPGEDPSAKEVNEPSNVGKTSTFRHKS